jgi:hypothetical protein
MTRLKIIFSLFILFSLTVSLVESHNHGKTKMGIFILNYLDSSTRVTYASLIKLRH